MPAILDIPEVRQRVSPLSVAEYHQLGEFNENGRRTELIRGIVIEKMSKSPLHGFLASVLYQLLLKQLPPGYSVWKEEPLTLRDSEPEPDVAIVRGIQVEFIDAHPTTAELVIEVAVSSATLDRENASLYAEAGITEYWIVLANERCVEVYRQPKAGVYQEKKTVRAGEAVECAGVPGVRIELAELFH